MYSRRAAIVLALVVAASSVDCTRDTSAKTETEAEIMTRGVNLMYQGNDPFGAEAVFRQVLATNPTHYGAHYQLAVALDRTAKPKDARVEWTEVQRLADAIKDTTTLGTARRRLASPDTASQDAMMAAGLKLVFGKGDFPAAAAQFRSVLERNPAHYGATYQLAAVLDRMGQPAQARPLWVKVLGMATTYKDDKTIQAARDRLR
jgi:Flp pilus assembly protein TadD